METTQYMHEAFELTHEAIEDTIDIKKTDAGYTVKYLVHDTEPHNPRENDNLGTMTCFHSRYNLGDKHAYSDPRQLLFSLAENYLILPLFLYDHSGITMNTSGFSCQWDSGQVGYIYVSHEGIIKEYDKLDIEMATKLLTCEVTEYDNMLTGNVYGLVSETYTEDKEQIDHDSCWGYFGYEHAQGALKTYF